MSVLSSLTKIEAAQAARNLLEFRNSQIREIAPNSEIKIKGGTGRLSRADCALLISYAKAPLANRLAIRNPRVPCEPIVRNGVLVIRYGARA